MTGDVLYMCGIEKGKIMTFESVPDGTMTIVFNGIMDNSVHSIWKS